MLKIQNLSASYHNHQVLHDVSFDVKNGEVLALIGQRLSAGATVVMTSHQPFTVSAAIQSITIAE